MAPNNSLNSYYNNMPQPTVTSSSIGAGCPANNFCRPPVSASEPLFMMNGNGTIPGFFGPGNTTDPILSFMGSSCYATPQKTTAEKVAQGVTWAAALAGMALPLIGIVGSFVSGKKDKSISDADQPQKSLLESCTETANGLGDDATVDQLTQASENLTKAIELSTAERKDAYNKVVADRTTLDTVDKKLIELEDAIKPLNTRITILEDEIKLNTKEIDSLNKQLDSGKSASGTELTIAERTALEKQIKELREKNKKSKDEIDDKKKDLEKLEKEKAKKLKEKEELKISIQENTALYQKLDSDIAAANTAVNTINEKIDQQGSEE